MPPLRREGNRVLELARREGAVWEEEETSPPVRGYSLHLVCREVNPLQRTARLLLSDRRRLPPLFFRSSSWGALGIHDSARRGGADL